MGGNRGCCSRLEVCCAMIGYTYRWTRKSIKPFPRLADKRNRNDAVYTYVTNIGVT